MLNNVESLLNDYPPPHEHSTEHTTGLRYA